MKVALVHDYLTQRGGAERVFELLCKCFPDADIFTSLYDPERTIDLGDRRVNTTFLQKIPNASKYFRLLAPFYYPAFRMLDLQEYNLIISSSSSFAKGVRKRPGARHICFCHNITRFLWDTQVYLQGYREFQLFAPIIEKIFIHLRRLDVQYSKEPDLYIANSTTVANRIRDIYHKPATTINYPIDERKFIFADRKEDFYLVCCRLLSYKRVDIIIEAFNALGWPLTIVGIGPEYQRLVKTARPNIRFLGDVSDDERAQLMSRARGVVVAALEDYGLVPIEANFSGTPTIAYGAGGVLDTQIPRTTGIFFDRQTPAAVRDAVVQADQMKWNHALIRKHALDRFTEAVFCRQIRQLIDLTQSQSDRDADPRGGNGNEIPSAEPTQTSTSRVREHPNWPRAVDRDVVMATTGAESLAVDLNYGQGFDSNEVAMDSQGFRSSPEDDSVGYGQILPDSDRFTTMSTRTTSLVADEEEGYGQILAVLLRRKYWILASCLGAVAIAWLATMQIKPTYRSSMQLLVDQNYRGKTEQGAGNPQQFADTDVQVDYATQLTLMNSSSVIQRIVDRLKPSYPKLTIDDVKKSLVVSQVAGKTADKKVDTKIFEAAYEDNDPVRARKILQTVQQVYQDYNKEQQQLRLTKGLAFINEQLPQVQLRVKQAESELENFRKTQNFIDPQLQSQALVESLNKIAQEQRANSLQVEDFRARSRFLEQKLALSPPALAIATRMSQSVRYQTLLNEIQRTELTLGQQRLRYTEESSLVKNSTEQLQQLQTQLASELRRMLPAGTTVNTTTTTDLIKAGALGSVELNLASQFIEAQANLKVAVARQQQLAQIEQQYRQQIQRFPTLLAEYNRLQPAVEVNRETLQRLLKARQDLGLEIARGGFDWQVVEQPNLGKKTGPDLTRNLLLGGIVGTFLGGAIAFVRDALDDSIHSVAALQQQTALPVLGAVPQLSPPQTNRLGLKSLFSPRQRRSLDPSSWDAIDWLPVRESIDLVCKNIDMLDSETFIKSLAVTSTLPGEGKSTVALGLAISAARLHKRVLLIDANFRRSSLHTQLNLTNDRGLSTLLDSETKSHSQQTIHILSSHPNLSVLTAGPIPFDPVRLLSSRRMAALMTEFEANYDLVIVDAPPLLGVVDTAMVASMCSGVVLVERIGRVNRKHLNQAGAVINMNRLNVVGLIPNGVDYAPDRDAAAGQGLYVNYPPSTGVPV